jgi:hypothetical protein
MDERSHWFGDRSEVDWEDESQGLCVRFYRPFFEELDHRDKFSIREALLQFSGHMERVTGPREVVDLCSTHEDP